MSELNYEMRDGYLMPIIALSETDQRPIGKYGMLRKDYLKKRRPILYNKMVVNGTLQQHLLEIEQTAQERLELMMTEMSKQEGLTEQMKAENQMEWVGRMNNLKARIEEILMAELIYN